MHYVKPPLTFDDQVKLLMQRGLLIPDREKAIHYLSNISYYRLSAYMLPFQIPQDSSHRYKPNTSFDDILELYVFDRDLKLLAFDAIERIEIAVRTQLIYHMSHAYGNNWFENSSLFTNRKNHEYLLNKIAEQCNQTNKEVFIQHYQAKYTSPLLPPSWMSLELLSMGQISQLFEIIGAKREKKIICNYFNLPEPLLTSWLHSLSYIRNICAHHARLWNRAMAVRPKLPIKPITPWLKYTELRAERAYVTMAIIQYLLTVINPTSNFKVHLKELFDKYPDIRIKSMGFPYDWQEDEFWQ